MKILLLIFLSLLSLPLLAQEVSNVQVRKEDDELIVTFDLSGSLQQYVAEIELAEDGEHFRLLGKTTNAVSGKNSYSVKEPLYCPSGIIRVRVRAKNPFEDIFEQMVLVKGGEFQMGSNDEGYYEKPVHRVEVSDFYMAKYEVTQQQWKMVMGSNPGYFKNCADCPVEQVSWEDVQQFLHKLNAATGKNYRLPTEAEWEYAARGGSKSAEYTYSGSNDPNSVAWNAENSGGKTHPVGQKQANELGLYDMSGNVWEWFSDWYDANYYASSPGSNPQGAVNGTSRAIRGGSWFNSPVYCRVAFRGRLPPGLRSDDLGFRLVISSR